MNLKSTKKVPSIEIPGLGIELDIVDEKIVSVTFNLNGNLAFKISHRDYYGIEFLIQAPPKMVEKYRVSGAIEGIDVHPRLFDYEHEATSCINQVYSSSHTLKVEKVEVPEE